MTLLAQILGIGTAVPNFEIEQADAAHQASELSCATAQQERLMTALYRRAGVSKRHSVVLKSSTNGHPAEQSFYRRSEFDSAGPTTADRMRMYETCAAPLAVEAAKDALTDAQLPADRITHLITVSCSGFSAPGVDLAMIDQLSLLRNTARTHIGFMGCHGAINGLRVAKAFAESNREACILLCAVELCSLHHQYGWDAEQIVANALFADGAAAAVIQAKDPSQLRAPAQLADFSSAVLPDCGDLMQWRIEDHGFQMTLSPQVPEIIQRTLRDWLTVWLAEHDLEIDQVGSWAIHPGGPRILAACAQALQSKVNCLSDSLEVLNEFGNMSSPTVLFILDRLRRRNAPKPYVALAFGPGIGVEAALLK
jgi:predicted naringenin-chalcone synthase